MARGFGKILSRIWDDRDFLALTPSQQRLYFFLGSQTNLNHAGLLPLTLRKWSKKAAGLTPDAILADLVVLDAARFVVLDEETEEVLIRTFIRNDDVWKMPRVMGSAVSGALEIESHRLRRALLAEMARIPLEELSDEPIKNPKTGAFGPSIRAQVAGHIDTLCTAFANLDPEPAPQPLPQPAPEPVPQPPAQEIPQETAEPLPEGVPEVAIEGVTEPPPDPLPEGVLEGVVLPPNDPLPQPPPEGGRQPSTRVGAPAHARALPLHLAPTTGPLPNPLASGGGGEPPRQQPLLALVDDNHAAVAVQPPQTADELVGYWIRNVPKRPPSQVIGRVGKSIKAMLAENIDPADIAAGLETWAIRGKDPSVLPSIVNEVMNATNTTRPAGGTTPGDELGGDAHMNRYLARAAARKAREA